MTKDQLKAAHAAGCRIQIWHLAPGATSSADGQWDDADPTAAPTFECPAHLYRVHPDDRGALSASSGEVAVVPTKFGIPADAWESAQFMFGGPGTGPEEPFMDCTAWVGEIEGDDGTKTYGLHIACNECPEEGSITLSEFAAPQPSPPVVDEGIVKRVAEALTAQGWATGGEEDELLDGVRAAMTLAITQPTATCGTCGETICPDALTGTTCACAKANEPEGGGHG